VIDEYDIDVQSLGPRYNIERWAFTATEAKTLKDYSVSDRFYIYNSGIAIIIQRNGRATNRAVRLGDRKVIAHAITEKDKFELNRSIFVLPYLGRTKIFRFANWPAWWYDVFTDDSGKLVGFKDRMRRRFGDPIER
jgi:hypothetical protein